MMARNHLLKFSNYLLIISVFFILTFKSGNCLFKQVEDCDGEILNLAATSPNTHTMPTPMHEFWLDKFVKKKTEYTNPTQVVW